MAAPLGPTGAAAVSPRTSSVYTATLALLQASIVAVSSDIRSASKGKPAEKRMTILRPGIERRFLAKLRMERNRERAPRSASALLRLIGFPALKPPPAAVGSFAATTLGFVSR